MHSARWTGAEALAIMGSMGIADAVAGLVDRLVSSYWEARLGIRTKGAKSVSYQDAERYDAMHYRLYFKALRRCAPGPDDVVMDLGCGKGRLLCCAALFDVREVIGVDVDGALCEIARENARAMRGRRCPIRVLNMPAQECDYRDATIITMVNPFGRQTVAAVLERLRTSLADNPRSVKLVYFNPVHDDVPGSQSSWLRRIEHWPVKPWAGRRFAVSFWEARSPAA